MCHTPLASIDPFGKALTNNTIIGDPLHLYHAAPDPNAAANAAAANAAAEQAEIQKTIDTINTAFDGRSADYQKYYNDTFNAQKSQIDQNNAVGQRNLKFNLARGGNLGGSNDVYQHGLMAKDYNQALLNASTNAQGAEAQLQSADAAQQQNLINMALSGGLSTNAAQLADSAMASNLSAASANQPYISLADMFSNMGNAYQDYEKSVGQGGPTTSVGNAISSVGSYLSNLFAPAG